MESGAIGPYRIVDRLGAGGMGEVFLAFDSRLDRKVALKVLSDPWLDTPQIRERLLREARAAAHITHPNIAAIYDILETCEPPCIVMEYAQGETLSAIAARGPMACHDVLKVALQLVDAVGHAHAAGVIHRDLKPANVVLTPDGVVKVLDFGLARVREIEQEQNASDAPTCEHTGTQVGVVAGTTAYMAPEQFVRKPASRLSDIYSLGATLYELLAGRRPFDAATTQDLVYEIVSKPTPRVSAAIPEIPPAVDAIVARAMAKDLAERYQSVAEMAEDLRQAELECRPGSRSGSGRTTALLADVTGQATASRTWKLAVAAAGLAGVALMVTFYTAFWRPSRAVPPVESQLVAVLPFTIEGGGASDAPEAAGYTEAVVAALEGLSAVSVLSNRGDALHYVPSSGDLRRQAVARGVTLIVSGSVAVSGDARHVSVKVERTDGGVASSKGYSGTAGDVSRLQAQAVQDIVRALNVVLTPADRQRLRQVPACRPETYGALAAGHAALDHPDIIANLQSAEAIFRKAAAVDPSCALAHAALADASVALYAQTKDVAWMAHAEPAIQKAIQLDPDSPAIKASLAEYYNRKGLYDQAAKVIREVITQRPFDDEAHRILADVYEAEGRVEEALAELQIAIERRPRNALSFIVLGNLQIDRGKYADALKSYREALRIQPDNAWATSNICTVFFRQSEYQHAADCFKALPPDATNLSNLGAAYYYLGRFQEAADACKRAVEMEPRSDVKRWNLADAYDRLGDRTQAMEQFRQAAELARELLKVDGKNARAWSRHAYYDARLGRAQEATRHAATAVDLAPRDESVLYRCAVVHALVGRQADAVAWLDRALQAGYEPRRAVDDADLASIRQLPKVQELLKESRQENPAR